MIRVFCIIGFIGLVSFSNVKANQYYDCLKLNTFPTASGKVYYTITAYSNGRKILVVEKGTTDDKGSAKAIYARLSQKHRITPNCILAF